MPPASVSPFGIKAVAGGLQHLVPRKKRGKREDAARPRSETEVGRGWERPLFFAPHPPEPPRAPSGGGENAAGERGAPGQAAGGRLHARGHHHPRLAPAGEGRPARHRHERRGGCHPASPRRGRGLRGDGSLRPLPFGARDQRCCCFSSSSRGDPGAKPYGEHSNPWGEPGWRREVRTWL